MSNNLAEMRAALKARAQARAGGSAPAPAAAEPAPPVVIDMPATLDTPVEPPVEISIAAEPAPAVSGERVIGDRTVYIPSAAEEIEPVDAPEPAPEEPVRERFRFELPDPEPADVPAADIIVPLPPRRWLSDPDPAAEAEDAALPLPVPDTAPPVGAPIIINADPADATPPVPAEPPAEIVLADGLKELIDDPTNRNLAKIADLKLTPQQVHDAVRHIVTASTFGESGVSDQDGINPHLLLIRNKTGRISSRRFDASGINTVAMELINGNKPGDAIQGRILLALAIVRNPDFIRARANLIAEFEKDGEAIMGQDLVETVKKNPKWLAKASGEVRTLWNETVKDIPEPPTYLWVNPEPQPPISDTEIFKELLSTPVNARSLEAISKLKIDQETAWRLSGEVLKKASLGNGNIYSQAPQDSLNDRANKAMTWLRQEKFNKKKPESVAFSLAHLGQTFVSYKKQPQDYALGQTLLATAVSYDPSNLWDRARLIDSILDNPDFQPADITEALKLENEVKRNPKWLRNARNLDSWETATNRLHALQAQHKIADIEPGPINRSFTWPRWIRPVLGWTAASAGALALVVAGVNHFPHRRAAPQGLVTPTPTDTPTSVVTSAPEPEASPTPDASPTPSLSASEQLVQDITSATPEAVSKDTPRFAIVRTATSVRVPLAMLSGLDANQMQSVFKAASKLRPGQALLLSSFGAAQAGDHVDTFSVNRKQLENADGIYGNATYYLNNEDSSKAENFIGNPDGTFSYEAP